MPPRGHPFHGRLSKEEVKTTYALFVSKPLPRPSLCSHKWPKYQVAVGRNRHDIWEWRQARPLTTAELASAVAECQLSKLESNTEPLLGIVSWEHLPLRPIILDHSILEGAVKCLYGNNGISWRVTPLSYRWCFGQHHHMWLIGCLFTPMVSHTSSPLTEELIYSEITVVLRADIKKSIVLTSPRSTWLDGMMECHIEGSGFFSIQFLFYIRV